MGNFDSNTANVPSKVYKNIPVLLDFMFFIGEPKVKRKKNRMLILLGDLSQKGYTF